MIIGGAIGLLVNILALAGGGLLGGLVGLGITLIITIGGLIASIIQLAAGITGAKNWNKPSNARLCIAFGFVIIVITLLSNIISGALGGGVSVSGLFLGLVLPVLYLIGAFNLKKSADN